MSKIEFDMQKGLKLSFKERDEIYAFISAFKRLFKYLINNQLENAGWSFLAWIGGIFRGVVIIVGGDQQLDGECGRVLDEVLRSVTPLLDDRSGLPSRVTLGVHAGLFRNIDTVRFFHQPKK